AYLAVRLAMGRVGARVLVVSGAEHVALGVLLGPSVLGLGLFAEPTALLPFAALATGWVGLSCGTEFNLRVLRDVPRGGSRLGVMTALVSGALVTAVAWMYFRSGSVGRITTYDAWLSAGMMGAASAATSTGPLSLLARRYQLGEAIVLLLRRAARLANLTALMGFGLLFCIFHPTFAVTDRPLSAVEFAVVAIGLGVLLGLVFAPFLGRSETTAGRALSLMAMVLFASGVLRTHRFGLGCWCWRGLCGLPLRSCLLWRARRGWWCCGWWGGWSGRGWRRGRWCRCEGTWAGG
ncbi:MAG: hypothetical protein MUF54_05800, partial [Polyangiaceae bacterium]|nr:hypothetical protein [Polyangiaceae bacterium]